MKSRTVTTLWIVALALGAAVFFLKQNQGGETANKTTRAAGETLIPDFPAAETSTISISGADQSVNLTRKDGKWAVAERDGFAANTRNVNEFLRTLSELKVTQGIEAGPSFAPRFGMDENSPNPTDRGITATFKDKDDKQLAKVSFGKNLDAVASSSPFGGGATGRYVRNHADKSGFYAVSEVFGILSAEPKSWLADDFINLEKIESISVTKPGSDENEWALTRPDETADFSFTEVFPGVKIDPAAVSPLKSLFSYARFDDVVSADKAAELATPEEFRKVTIGTFEGFTYKIDIQPAKPQTPESKDDAASPSAEEYLMEIKVSADLPKQRKKPEGEKPEEEEAAEKAFTERHKTLMERLEATKKLEGRTFLVSKFTVDALLKGRAELMDKGPGPEADSATPQNSTSTPMTGTAAHTSPIEIPVDGQSKGAPKEEEVPVIEIPEPELPKLEEDGSVAPPAGDANEAVESDENTGRSEPEE